ncbi:hypothetical protein GQ43DRAFT_412641 [Delitschia confertaspora ATCC 74209]|uniref:Sas10 C-terminal domain-containing protein n=1 Tax=Delitschia confertaspora ATCC 74209 TaxID=1513339 RepID=A0A9P4JPT6_9PLEO|nr:hypothetical protein GQ43DRAFT_412641 [Delitschia confertaspora ATCC 74209]
MGKKRKAGGKPSGEPKEYNENTKMRISTYEDVADSEDEFYLNQDKILLDEAPQAKRLRKWKEEDKFLEPSDEEVLNYSEDEDDDDEDLEEEEYDEQDADMSRDRGAGTKKDQDEEDLDGELGGWGPSKKDYYNADAIETEQDALDEEKEALRLQKQQLARLGEDDYMLDDWLEPADEGKAKERVDGEGDGNVVTEVLPRMQISKDMTETERLKLLHTWYPEVEHLRKDFGRLQPVHEALSVAARATEQLQKATRNFHPSPVITKYRACASYLGAIAMYFALFTSPAAKLQDGETALPMEPSDLHDHPIMETLLKSKQLWEKVEHIPIADSEVATFDDNALSAIEEAESIIEAQTNSTDAGAKDKTRNKKLVKKSRAQRAAEAAQAEAEARRAEKIQRTEEELAALAALTDTAALRRATKKKEKAQVVILPNGDESDIGDETELTAHELAEKAKKKKSLRFYTSQITQKSMKRGAAGRDQGGDMDVPHRERLKDRQARLQAEAEKRGQQNKGPGVDLGGDGDSDGEDAGSPRGNDEDEYYDLVASRSKAKKQTKSEAAAAYAAAAAQGGRVVEQEVIGADGKRKISYLIEKNKGLTPHRKKEVRNPRVKKKLKYAEKQKKLKSQKAVYNGGEGRGGYKGELTGIKKGLVKSVKL